MYEFKELVEYAETYNFENFEKLFKKLCTSVDPIIILKEINKKVNFIDQRPKKTSTLKNDFLMKINGLLKEEGIENNLVETIKFFEAAYADILLKRDEIKGDTSSEYIIAAIIVAVYISNYNLKLHLDSILNNCNSFHEKMYLNQGPLGENINPDNFINALSKILTNNINIECYTNNWFEKKSGGIAILPKEILKILEVYDASEKKHIDIVKNLSVNTGLWDILEEADFHFRLLKEDIVFCDNGSITISNNNDSKFLKYASIANERISRMILNNIVKMNNINKKGKNYFIYQEKIKFSLLLHVDIDNDQEYDGLTVKEWINSFYLLRDITLKSDSPIILSDDELVELFSQIHVNEEKCKKVINSLLFKKGTPDIFDTPIVKFEGGLNLLISFGLNSPNMINIISSILSKKELALKNKGENFEANAFNLFKKLEKKFNFRCSSPNRKINGEQYQYDIVIEWDDLIFIFECKNRSIPSTLPTSISSFREKIDEYTYQVNRLKYALSQNPNEFSIDITSKKIVPVIMNSLSFSLDFEIDGVIFTDFSIISRFFSERYLTKNVIKKGHIKKENIYDQWNGKLPRAIDFLNFISNPFQVVEAKKRFIYSETKHDIIGHSLIIDRSFIK
ncbi:hypothetical protein [Acinetobacter sp. H1(2024)]|uniref:hypothetical protein n=1 Tax=Acinetobacter sp. H1(2024) TaxID=3390190 RepID=UPI00397D97B0